MDDSGSLVRNTCVKNDEDTKTKFPYKILNDLATKLKAAEDQLTQERKFFEMKITKILAENESNRCECTQSAPVSNKVKPEVLRDAFKDALFDEISKLKQEVSQLVYENNRYHLSISYCTVCTSDDEFSDASLSDVSIKASTPVSASLDTLEPSISPVPCSSSGIPALSSTVPALMPGTVVKGRKLTNTVVKRKDETFINRMVKTLTKLEAKYKIPDHKRKKRLFTRKSKPSSIVPKELATIYNVLAAPEPEAVTVPKPFPNVRWRDVRFKPALPKPESCAVSSCSQDPGFYQDKVEYRNGSVIPTCRDSDYVRLARHNGLPFGALPGYKTNRGVVAVPTTPVGGYVYCPDANRWVIFAEPCSSPASVGRGTRRGGATSLARRRGG